MSAADATANKSDHVASGLVPDVVLTVWTFRLMLLKRAYTDDALRRIVSESRFGRGEIIHEGIGFDLRLAK